MWGREGSDNETREKLLRQQPGLESRAWCCQTGSIARSVLPRTPSLLAWVHCDRCACGGTLVYAALHNYGCLCLALSLRPAAGGWVGLVGLETGVSGCKVLPKGQAHCSRFSQEPKAPSADTLYAIQFASLDVNIAL